MPTLQCLVFNSRGFLFAHQSRWPWVLQTSLGDRVYIGELPLDEAEAVRIARKACFPESP